jgi:hypothetical protein
MAWPRSVECPEQSSIRLHFSRACVQNHSPVFESGERKGKCLATSVGNKHFGYRDVLD